MVDIKAKLNQVPATVPGQGIGNLIALLIGKSRPAEKVGHAKHPATDAVNRDLR